MRFNPAFFAHLEKRIAQLRDLGIEADLILFHPYDADWGQPDPHWGFDRMGAENDDRYIRYVIARWRPIAMSGGRWPTSGIL